MKKFLLKTSLAIAALLASITVSAHDFEVDGIYYNIINDTSKTVEVTYKGYSPTEYEKEYSGGVDIPSNVTYNGATYTVSKIGIEAFYECSELTDLTIPNTIDVIDDQFIGCSGLTAVNISDLSAWCKINFGSQSSNPLSLCQKLILNGEVVKELIIPEDITEIGGWTFRCCTELTSVKIHNSVSKIGPGAFENCIGLTSITIPESVTEIWWSAFCGCSKLSNIDIHDSVTHIGDLAFYDTEWYNTNIQANNVLYLGCYCIRGDAYGNLDVKTGTRLIADRAFEYCTGITSVNLPNTLVSIGTYAFSKCTNLETVSISNSVKDIGFDAFFKCANLQNINVDTGNPSYSSIDGVLFNADKTELVAYPSGRNGEYSVPDGVKTFAFRAFAACTGLTGITLPFTLVSTGEETFESCTGLTSMTIPNSVTEIGLGAFGGCANLSAITLSNSLISIGQSAFSGCAGLTSITIPKTVTNIGKRAFYNCSNLTEVNIQDISAWCNIEFGSSDSNPLYYSGHIRFNGAEVTELNIPSGTPAINDYAFVNCSNLTTVGIPNSVTSIGTYAFQNCTGLTAVVIPENATRIGNCAFLGCIGLTDITIPKSVESLGQSVFNGCTNLTTLNFDAENCSCDGLLFGFGGAPLKNVNIGNTVRIIPEGTFYSCQNITEIVIPNSVVEIGFSAFNNCTGLTTIVIPKSVTSIGGAAFSRCSNLIEITSLSTTPPVCGNDYTFYGLADSCQLKVPANTKELYATSYGWSEFSNIIEIATVEVSTQESNATFEIPTTEGAATYTVNVYSDEAMTQLVATTNYDAAGNIIPMSTSLELSIDGFENGTYYYDVIAKSESGETLNNYTGSFEIVTSGISNVGSDDTATEVARYDIHGRLLSAPAKGINIVKYSDGTVKKIVIN